jgi:CDP-diacylglycerol pyrophosphatase
MILRRMSRRRWAIGGMLAAALVGAVGLLFGPDLLNAADPDALWKIVHGVCVPHQELALDPSPCAFVSAGSQRELGYAVLKDRSGATQYLLIPTDKVTGIEDPKLLKPGTETYLIKAWAFRSLLFARLGHDLPAQDVSLAINSVPGRSQNQLHIHIDCVRPDVRDALKAAQASIGPEWKPLAPPFSSHTYQAMAIPAQELERSNLFHRLARTVPAGSMGQETLVVIGAILADGKPGFDILTDRVGSSPGDMASGEELQDHDCAVKSDTPPA